MFGSRYLLAVAVVAVMATRTHGKPRSLNLKDVLKKTVCAIEVKVNEDENRIPAKIKTIKCLSTTEESCKENKIDLDNCCHSTDKYAMECVEMVDFVMVKYKNSTELEKLEVPVGCACIIGNSTQALSVTAPP